MRITFLIYFVLLVFSGLTTAGENHSATYVGRAICAQCHAKQTTQWVGSHHDLAMQVANDKSVLGNFDNVSLTHYGITSYFYRKGRRFMVRTEGPNGKLQDYQIKYTFGVFPLQQYLIEFPGGRMQALSLAWDSRPQKQGGQRWFHLYPGEKITHDDELHWTRPSQNWNSICAECHSTRLDKNYDPTTKTFTTTWSEIDVSCEACHGPGAEHVSWARRKPGWEALSANKGLSLSLDERQDVHWKINPETGNAARSKARSSDKEIEICARCHSRRALISNDYIHGKPLLDHYLPRLLDEGMYHADGQIDDEVYVYGSFVQSKMHFAGVTCSDCHEPHSLELRATGDRVCLQCHQATKYDKHQHHFHKVGSQGANCVECHMPTKTYMVIDPRHDHSIRIPRPDLSVKMGIPNACNNCHQDKGPQWASKQVKNWYGHVPSGFQSYAQVLQDARNKVPGVEDDLAMLIRNKQTPDIARATALAQLGPYLTQDTIKLVALELTDGNASVREAAVRSLDYVPVAIRVQLALPLLEDPVRAVRIEAARVLASVTASELPDEQRSLLANALQEYITAQQASAERPEVQVNLGNLYLALGQIMEAFAAYKAAMALDSAYVPAYVNLADLYRSQGNEAEAEKVLRQVVAMAPENAAGHHALGLSLIRQRHIDAGVKELQRAATLSPENVRYVYVYAIALNSIGKSEQAIMVLQGAHAAHPGNSEILQTLVMLHRDRGNQEAAQVYAEKLRAISP